MIKVGEGPIWWPADGGPFQPIAECLSGAGCGRLLWEDDPRIFLIMTLVLGGGCAWMAGRSLAQSWRPLGVLLFYMALFGFALRFLHWGLFSGTLLEPYYYLSDTLVLMLIAAVSYRYARTNQMVTQYHWLYERKGPLSWTERPLSQGK